MLSKRHTQILFLLLRSRAPHQSERRTDNLVKNEHQKSEARNGEGKRPLGHRRDPPAPPHLSEHIEKGEHKIGDQKELQHRKAPVNHAKKAFHCTSIPHHSA